jgi:hypothetical protein
VKCDEDKPGCQRCLKWRGTCEGYEDRLATQQARSKRETASGETPPPQQGSERQQANPEETTRQILQWYPILSAETMKLLSRPCDLLQSPPPRPSGKQSPPAETGSELPPRAVPLNNGAQDTFWMLTVPHLLRTNESVRWANLAIHALIDAKRPQWVEEGKPQPGQDSYSRALKYHGTALGQVASEVVSRGALQSATLCCLFFIIFEMMNNDVRAAQSHMYNGCRMMDELRINTRNNRAATHGIENMLFRELQKAMRFVALQVRGLSFGNGSANDADIVNWIAGTSGTGTSTTNN